MLSFLVKAVKGFNISKLFLKNFQMLCPANCGVQAGVCQNGEQGTDYCSYDLAYDRLFLDVACGSVLYSFVLLVLMRTTAGQQHSMHGSLTAWIFQVRGLGLRLPAPVRS